MNLGDLAGSIPFVGQILPLLRLLGIDHMATTFEKQQVVNRLEKGVPAVVKRLETDGLTPAAKASSPEGERLFIRAALYLSLKEALKHILPGGKGANLVADGLRDAVDDKIVAQASPLMDEATTTEQAVRMIQKAYSEQVF